jgi:RNA polymerase sigma factor (sigma-70 family)
MPSVRSSALLHDLQTLFDTGTGSGQTDRQLLDRLATDSARQALEILIHRHGSMVMRVCRNLLSNPDDADDAFQATFLVMVTRKRSIRHLESLSGWLCGVATRVCAKSRSQSARRKQIEDDAASRALRTAQPEAEPKMENEEAARYLQQEVSNLPAKYRDIIVLCFMQGLTHEEAAQRLNRPLGTIRSRMARAKELLRKRLSRRGLTSPTVLLAAFDAGQGAAPGLLSATAAVSPQLITTTVQAALNLSTGVRLATVASSVVASLVHQTVWSMSMIKISSVMAGVALVGFSAIGAGVAQRAGLASDPKPALAQPPSAGSPTKDVRKGFIRKPSADPGSQPKAEGQKNAVANEPPSKILSQVEGHVAKTFDSNRLCKKGEVVLELDSSALKDQLINQRITTKSAEANLMNATLMRQLAESAVREFKDGQYPAELAEIDGDIKLAEAELAVAKEEAGSLNADPARRLEAKRAEVSMLRANLAIEKARNRRRVLVTMTRDRKVRELEGALERSMSNELSRQATWEFEQSKERKLERQIAACTITAPTDGYVGYMRELVEGVAVQRGEWLFYMMSPERHQEVIERGGVMDGGVRGVK